MKTSKHAPSCPAILFDLTLEKIEVSHKGSSYKKDISKPFYFNVRVKYLFHSRSRPWYVKGDGLWTMKNIEEVQLLNEYQFRLLLRHTKVREKILVKGEYVLAKTAIDMYKNIGLEEVEELDAVCKE